MRLDTWIEKRLEAEKALTFLRETRDAWPLDNERIEPLRRRVDSEIISLEMFIVRASHIIDDKQALVGKLDERGEIR